MAKKNSTTKNSNNAKKSVAANKRHGAHKICAHPSCSKQAFKGYEVCMRHGAKGKKCSEAGCLNMAINESVCIRHGAVSRKGKCAQEGCTNLEYLNGVCQRHGAKVYYCTQNDCSNKAIIGGVCRRHGARAYICRKKGCKSPANRGIVCYKHRHFQKIQSKSKEASSMPGDHQVQQKFNIPNSFVIIVGSSRMKRSLFESS
mmetsp:Transcript_6992/g.10186  ORF Transcript_6992/g.10186 Transcript_6992/m.10186 type:complete len:201 (+) Transcript_6992:117-719(+)